MIKNLVIVESPAKAKTLEKYLGKTFRVLSSYGHVRDLVPKKQAIDVDNGFRMQYRTLEKNADSIRKLVSQAKTSEVIYLATDPDREGEAIAWHLMELLKEKQALKDQTVYRISFNEITKNAVLNAVNQPRTIADDLVEAQQTRRALDFLVGFYLSPLLWKKIGGQLSAGRVQSPALRMIAERELAIQEFKPQEYWRLIADTEQDKKPFSAQLTRYDGEKISQFSINNATDAENIQQALKTAAQGKLEVINVEKKSRKRNPAPPFITSTLQQEAARKLGFNATKTMRTAQNLYEGIKINGTEVGLISYMRTDSTALSSDAVQAIRELIAQQYGKTNLPNQPKIYKTKAKNAQEAHEAIRPTDINKTPDTIRSYLTPEQFKLYQLIWQRTVACQMIHATINMVAVDLACGGQQHVFRANGSMVAKPGFILVYQESSDEPSDPKEDKMLPQVTVGQFLPLLDIHANQHFTEPPPRFTEATLIKALEEQGIGRPSTYAPILSTLKLRGYVHYEKKCFHPTDVGIVVNRFLSQYFTQYVDYDFTAKMENLLDGIASGKSKRLATLTKFWKPFQLLINNVEKQVLRESVVREALDEQCPECNNALSIRLGKNGRFIGCNNYPECRYTRDLKENKDKDDDNVLQDQSCPQCQSDLKIKYGRYGKFIGCSNYPDCKYIKSTKTPPEDTGIRCPKCQKSTLAKRFNAMKRLFYSCQGYPDCKYILNSAPEEQPCPQCQWPLTVIKTTKRDGTQRVCPQKCGFTEQIVAAPNHESSTS